MSLELKYEKKKKMKKNEKIHSSDHVTGSPEVKLCVCVCVFVSLRPDSVLKHGLDVPCRVEGAEATAEALVVDGPRVDGEQAHEQDEVAPSEHHLPDLDRGKGGKEGRRRRMREVVVVSWRETEDHHVNSQKSCVCPSSPRFCCFGAWDPSPPGPSTELPWSSAGHGPRPRT